MKTIALKKPVWAIIAMVASLTLASPGARAAESTDSGAVMPPTVTGGDADQIAGADRTADIRTPQVVDPDIRDVEMPEVETPEVETPDVHVPVVEVPDVHVPEVETPETN